MAGERDKPVEEGKNQSLTPPFNPDEERKDEPVSSEAADDSLKGLERKKVCKELMSGMSYQARNVYKSIIGHMQSYLRKNSRDITRVLEGVRFPLPKIEHAFMTIYIYYDQLQAKTAPQLPQALIDRMLSQRSIYTYILRETTNAILHASMASKRDKQSRTPSTIYKTACERIYNETVRLLSQSAQGKSYKL